MANRDLDFYMKLPYRVELVNIPDDLGGGYSVVLPELGRNAFIGDGDTIQEALESLDKIKEELFTRYLEKGIEIPIPTEEKEHYSGKILLRLPKDLHYRLAKQAEANEVSLNMYMVSLLSANSAFEVYRQQNQEILDAIVSIKNTVWRQINHYHIKADSLSVSLKDQEGLGDFSKAA